MTLALSQYVLPEDLYPWLTLASGLLVVGVGAACCARGCGRARAAHDHAPRPCARHDHEHARPRPSRPRTDEPGVARASSRWAPSAGLIPCPSALVVLLGAISQHQVALGLLLIFAFSLGLAATLTVLGLAVVSARRLIPVGLATGRLAAALPAVSALLIVAVGCVLTAQGHPGRDMRPFTTSREMTA